jgi:DNA topoisomerase-2
MSVLKYKKLTDTEHVLLRPGMYIGSIKPHTAKVYIIENDVAKSEVVTWNPGFVKLFDEVISNSVDHSNRQEGKHLDTIKVDIDRQAGTISVFDNGGIPVQIHPEHKEYVPTMIFGSLRSGSNFDESEDHAVTGQNGLGASLTNCFSTKFVIETCDGKSTFKQTFTNNMMEKTKPSIMEMDEPGYTRITYTPDYAHLGTTLDENYSKLVKRCYDIAGCNPQLKIYLNGKRIRIDSFKDYVKLYTAEFEIDETPDWQVAVTASDEGFKHVSFVNSTETVQGGSHIDYVTEQIVDKLREFFKSKHKVDIKPAEIKQHMRLFINARIIKPRYDSQTKENLITEPKEYKTSYKVSEKLITKLLKSSIIERVLIWVEAKARAKELEELRAKNKDLDKVNPKRILKLEDAGLAGKKPAECYLFIAEGDCIEDQTLVRTIHDSVLKDVPAGELHVGDLVLTHKNRYKPITNIAYAVKQLLEIKLDNNTMIRCSPEHKLLTYDGIELTWKPASSLALGDNVVRSTLLDAFHVAVIKVASRDDKIFTRLIELDIGFDPIMSSASHTFYCLDMHDLEYKMVSAARLHPGRHLIVFRYKYDCSSGKSHEVENCRD